MEHLSHFVNFITENTVHYSGNTQLKGRRIKFAVTVKGIGMDTLKYLSKPTMFITLRSDGSIMKVFNEWTLDRFDMEYFKPMNNGNPSFIVCNPTGHPVFSLMIDSEKDVLLLCDKDPHITN